MNKEYTVKIFNQNEWERLLAIDGLPCRKLIQTFPLYVAIIKGYHQKGFLFSTYSYIIPDEYITFEEWYLLYTVTGNV